MSACFCQGIQQWEGEALKKVIKYLTTHLLATFDHSCKNMEDCDMLSVFQIFLELWNGSGSFEEYVPDFMKISQCLQDQCAHMITETVSLLKHIRSCPFLPNINQVEKNG